LGDAWVWQNSRQKTMCTACPPSGGPGPATRPLLPLGKWRVLRAGRGRASPSSTKKNECNVIAFTIAGIVIAHFSLRLRFNFSKLFPLVTKSRRSKTPRPIQTMILEVVNSVFLTFLVTEYFLVDDDTEAIDANHYHSTNCGPGGHLMHIVSVFRVTLLSRQNKYIQFMFGLVGCLNLIVRFHVSGALISAWLHSKVERMFHIPRIVIAISSFLISLYFDCRRMTKSKYMTTNVNTEKSNNIQLWSNRAFFRQLVKSFCILLPVYPFIAVVISFGFLFIVSIFEKLDLPLQILNMPIYYGTLYGPLSYLYWDVKRKMISHTCVHGRVRVLGGTVLPR
jgi:hypothetical protein